MILTYGGGDPIVKAYGASAPGSVSPCTMPSIPTPTTRCRHKNISADLAFLGNRLPDRERRVEEFFINTAAGLPACKFILAGSGWDDKERPANMRYLGHLGTAHHNAFNCSPLAVLNISRDSMARNGFSPATRVFEAAGAGACIITDKWEGIEQFSSRARRSWLPTREKKWRPSSKRLT